MYSARQKYNLSFFSILIFIITAAAVLSGCGKQTSNAASSGKYETLELRYQGAVNSVTYPELAQDLGYLDPIKLKWIGNTTSGPQDIQSTVTGDVDFGSAFNGAIVKLMAAGAPIKSVIGSYGVDKETWSGFFVLDNSPIKSARDLIGKKVGMNTLGAHHEFMLKEYLRRNGLTEKEINQVTLVAIPPVNTEQSLRQKQIDVAVLGGILRDKALERGGIHALFSDYDLFGKFTAGSYVMTDKFLKENPNTAKKFVEGTAKAIEWARTTPREEVIARYEKIINERGRNEDDSTIKYWKSTGIAGKGGVISNKEFSVWENWLVEDGELKKGQLKANELYTNKFNPFHK
ncbi:ABC transporter substrate-binding protein [Priestia megaterium]|uniref:ABC transporter substrate-binding protein n=1 Tax=Priestia megaterium TaxID=1404 RepID=UPI001126AAA9|nr:ABC transporter substrate-binding protein [Priestia megaterium]TPF16983.1 ABC transporter substrate-binding protein [Priestia megaterium]TPF24042.1 ABC transporter substrate-binding protein [Priestia megaterium]